MSAFFIEGTHAEGDVVALDGSDAHKIVSVLRLRDGEEIDVIDSAAQRFTATLSIDGRSVCATLRQRKASAPAHALRVTVAQGVPKAQKMDFVVEKLTELGAGAIVPLQSERTVVSDVSPNKLERWRRLAKTAAQQCGRDDIPAIHDPQRFDDLCATFGHYDAVLFPWELAERAPLRERLPQLIAGARRVLVVIGPEGGFSHAEADAANAAGAHLISLGSRILRTETAALVVLSLLNYETETQQSRV
jgi:16S rRNA (uracil1498-N3)-methyltransferase